MDVIHVTFSYCTGPDRRRLQIHKRAMGKKSGRLDVLVQEANVSSDIREGRGDWNGGNSYGCNRRGVRGCPVEALAVECVKSRYPNRRSEERRALNSCAYRQFRCRRVGLYVCSRTTGLASASEAKLTHFWRSPWDSSKSLVGQLAGVSQIGFFSYILRKRQGYGPVVVDRCRELKRERCVKRIY